MDQQSAFKAPSSERATHQASRKEAAGCIIFAIGMSQVPPGLHEIYKQLPDDVKHTVYQHAPTAWPGATSEELLDEKYTRILAQTTGADIDLLVHNALNGGFVLSSQGEELLEDFIEQFEGNPNRLQNLGTMVSKVFV